MLPYLAFFLVPALVALTATPIMYVRPDGATPVRITFASILVIIALTVVIGFRFEVGGDWTNYFRYLNEAEGLSIGEILAKDDPGYWALNKISNTFGWGMTGVNVMAALAFSTGLVVLSRSLPRPWLAIACAVPYFVSVVAMGYTRQAIAVGFVMIGLVALMRMRLLTFALTVLVGALFHKSAVLVIVLAGLLVSQNRWQSTALVAVAGVLGYFFLLQDSADRLMRVYQDQYMESTGALIRLAMNTVPAVIFLLFRSRFGISAAERRVFLILSLASIGMIVVYFLTNLSTALDRMALYIIPLQLMVFSHVPDVLGTPGRRNSAIVSAILIYYALCLLAWFNFATNAQYWLPYRMGFA